MRELAFEFDRLNIQLQALKTEMQQGQAAVAAQIGMVDGRTARLENKLDEVLQRLPPKP